MLVNSLSNENGSPPNPAGGDEDEDEDFGLGYDDTSLFISNDRSFEIRCVFPPRRSSSAGVSVVDCGAIDVSMASCPFARSFLIDG